LGGSAALYAALGLAAAMYLAWCIGANDAANPTAKAVGPGAVPLKRALAVFAVFATVGALAQGYMVIKTIGKGVVAGITPLGALCSSVAAGLWVTLATRAGLPISTTHSAVSAVVGVGFAMQLLGEGASVNLSVLRKVVASWVVSPLSAIALTVAFYAALSKLTELLMSRGVRVELWYRRAFYATIAFQAYSFGANDVGNATGVYVTVVSGLYGMPDEETMRLLALLGAAGIALGAFTWGYRVVETCAYRITSMDYVSGLAGQLGGGLVVWLFTTVPYYLFGFGMPISTTHAAVGSIIGAGLARHKKMRGVNWKTVLVIFASWIFTLPVAASAGAAVYLLVRAALTS